MTRSVLEHVAAANPEPTGREVSTEEQAERDAIRAMVLADPLPEPATTPPRRRSRRILAFAAVAASLAIAVAVTVSGRDGSFVDRAHAAITASGIFHVVEESSIDAPPAVLQDERFEGWRPARKEAWYDREDRASHFIVSAQRGGRFVPVLETAENDGELLMREADGAIHEVEQLGGGSSRGREYYALDLFENAYRRDKVRDDGEVTVDGRRLRRLVLDIPPVENAPGPNTGPTRQVMLFDPRTLYPVQLTMTSTIEIDGVEHPITATSHFRAFERLPATAENRALLRMR